MTAAAIARRGLSWPKTRRRVTPPRLRQTEAQFQAAIIELARGLGWKHYFTHDSRKSPPGYPDLVLLRPPRQIVAELKSRRGVLTLDQRDWLNSYWLCGVETYVWRVGETDIRTIADLLTSRTMPVDIRPLGAPGRECEQSHDKGHAGAAPTRAAPELSFLMARRD